MSPVATAAINFPVQKRSLSKTVNLIPTDISIQVFSNRVFLVINQCEGSGLGTFLEVTKDKPEFDHFDPDSNTFNIQTLFGADTEQIQLAARIFAGALQVNKPVLLSIGLRDFSRENLFAIRDTLVSLVAVGEGGGPKPTSVSEAPLQEADLDLSEEDQ